MEQETILSFKCELKKYKYYQNTFNDLWEKRYVLRVKETGLHSIDYSQERVQGSPDMHKKEQRRIQIIDDIEKLDKDINKVQRKIVNINNAIVELNKKDDEFNHNIGIVLMNVYCEKLCTIEDEAKRLHLSRRQMNRIIDKSIENMALSTVKNVLI